VKLKQSMNNDTLFVFVSFLGNIPNTIRQC
jgi:hypothetical protein